MDPMGTLPPELTAAPGAGGVGIPYTTRPLPAVETSELAKRPRPFMLTKEVFPWLLKGPSRMRAFALPAVDGATMNSGWLALPTEPPDHMSEKILPPFCASTTEVP